jgi:hypothetical protein
VNDPCLLCGKLRPIMVVMAPGPGGGAWQLCSGCYLDGVRPMNQVGDTPPPAKQYAITPPATVSAPEAKPTKRRRA